MWLRKLCRPTCITIQALVGVVFIGLGALSTIFGFQVVDKLIYKKLELVEGGETYEAWRKSPVEPLLKVYFFNVTNSEEFRQGQKPVLKEVGPYVYNEKWINKNVIWHSNDTVSYIPTKQYFFNRELSNGDETDLVKTLDVLVVSAAIMVKYESTEQQRKFNVLLKNMNDTLFSIHAVGELLWGYDSYLFDFAKNDFKERNEVPPSEYFGLFAGKNGTAIEGRYTIFTGHDSINTLGKIDNWNGKTKLPYWRTDKCNNFAGSSTGSMYPPDMKKEDTLYLFNPELCRTLPLVFKKEVNHRGIMGYRFGPPDNVFDSAAQNPDNECYCPISTSGPECGIQGLFNLSACKNGAPLAVSWPHFLHANSKLVEAVEGLHPDPEKHGFFMDFQPKVSKPMSAKARMQINLLLTEVSEVSTVAGLRDFVFPLFWFETGIDQLPEEFEEKLRLVANLPTILTGLNSAFFVFGGLLLTIVATISARRMQSKFFNSNETSRKGNAVIELEIELSQTRNQNTATINEIN